MMLKPVIEMERILRQESETYDAIYGIEEEKSRVIMERDAKSLESLSRNQESLLRKIAKLEQARQDQIVEYRRENRLDDMSRPVTLRDIVLSMDEDSSHHILNLGMELKERLLKLDRLQQTNAVLMRDTLDFFNMLISGLRSSASECGGYGSDGKRDERVARPAIINHTA